MFKITVFNMDDLGVRDYHLEKLSNYIQLLFIMFINKCLNTNPNNIIENALIYLCFRGEIGSVVMDFLQMFDVFAYKTHANYISFICVSNQNTVNFILTSLCWFFRSIPLSYHWREDNILSVLRWGPNISFSSVPGLCYIHNKDDKHIIYETQKTRAVMFGFFFFLFDFS